MNWIHVPSIKIETNTEFIKYKNLIAPRWMVDDDSFLLDIYENPQIAKRKFLSHIKENFTFWLLNHFAC